MDSTNLVYQQKHTLSPPPLQMIVVATAKGGRGQRQNPNNKVA
jgi:hypothetical protein